MKSSPNFSRFSDLLNKYRKKNDEEITHTSCGEPTGSFYISEENQDEFFSVYSLLVGTSSLHMIERPKKVGPLVIDIDLQYKTENRQYEYQHILHVIDILTSSMKEYFNIEYDNLTCYVFEKKKPTKVEKEKCDTIYKDGIHLMYPNIALNVEMRYFLLHELRTEGSGIFDELDIIKKEIKEIYDESVIISNGWIMYGSKKKDGDLYNLTHIINCEYTDSINEHKMSINKMVKFFSIRKYNDSDCISYRNIDDMEDGDEFETKLMNVKMLYIKSSSSSSKKKQKKDPNSESIDIQPLDLRLFPSEIKKKIERAIQLVDILSDRRAYTYIEWLSVGWALHNIHKGLLSKWLEFSQRCPEKYDEKQCIDIWTGASNDGYTIASLHWWAKEDNPSEYDKIIHEDVMKSLQIAESGTHYDLASVLHEMYKYTYVCSGIKGNMWYEFNDHRWFPLEECHSLRKKISSELWRKFSLLLSHYYANNANNANTQNNEEEPKNDKFEKKCDQIRKIMTNLKQSPFKNNIINECKPLFYRENFESKLDSNPNLIGFENGVYDLTEMKFREGLPDDNVYLSTEYNYVEFENNNKLMIELDNLFDKIYVNKKIKHYVLVFLASSLCGINREQKCEFFTGTGSNGKSTLMELIKHTFGKYYDVLPVTIFSRKRGNSSQATPELADKKGKRFLEVHEPEEDDKFNVGFLKELSASDNISARQLYGQQFSFVPQFKIVICCNNLPHIPALDNGTWRRIRVVPHESEFVDNSPDPNNKYQFKKDKSLSQKLKTYRQAFMWLLINVYYKIYLEEGLIEPNEVTISTSKYKSDSDSFLEFILECAEASEDTNNTDHESLSYLYEQYKLWFKLAHPNDKCSTKKSFATYFSNNHYIIKTGNVYGLKLKGCIEISNNVL